MSDLPPSLASRYQATRELGRGAFGRVVQATRREDGTTVAIKLLVSDVASQETVRERFFREGRAGSRLDHPHVVRVLEVGSQEAPYLVQEFVSGGNLEDHLTAHPRGLEPEEAAGILDGVLAGLQAAHQVGLTHRDLKPANILLDEQRRPKLADFGLAHGAFEATLTATGTILGTPLYMAPAQVLGEKPGPDWDVYAAAAIYYEMLLGHPAFDGATVIEVLDAKKRGLVAGPAAQGVAVPPGTDKLLRVALGPDHAVHYPDVATFRKAWAEIRRAAELGLETPTSRAGVDLQASAVTSVHGDLLSTAPPSRTAATAELPGAPEAAEPAGRPGWLVPALLVVGLGMGVGWGMRAAGSPPPPTASSSARSSDPGLGEAIAQVQWALKRDDQLAQVTELIGDAQRDAYLDELEDAAGVVDGALARLDLEAVLAAARDGTLDVEARRRFLDVVARSQLLGRMTFRGHLRDLRGPRHRALDEAYSQLVHVDRVPPDSLPVTNPDLPAPPLEVEAYGRRWSRIRGYHTVEKDISDKGRNYPNIRIRRRSPRGIPFQDPLSESRTADFLADQLEVKRDRSLLAAARDEASQALAEVPTGDLELALHAQAWHPTIQGRLILRGGEDEVTLPVFSDPEQPPPDAKDDRVLFRVRIHQSLVPPGTRALGVRYVGIQPFTDGESVVYLAEIWQRID